MIGDTRPSWHLHRYLQGSANLFEENRLLKVAIAGLFGITAVLGTLIYTSNQNTRTVIVPFGADGDLYVTGNKPSESYLRSITFNIVGLAGTYSAYSADRQFQELLRIAHPSAYNGLRDSLNRLLDELGNNPTLSIATYTRPLLPRPGAQPTKSLRRLLLRRHHPRRPRRPRNGRLARSARRPPRKRRREARAAGPRQKKRSGRSICHLVS
ncbi:type IV conjugative transfer system protein TraE [Sphingobium sp. PNB]|uniref:type IV conjugative transfer system protein TraE n=1 Tax=Sphingobium sp. PNB TaxID=863934 RepID=UPI001D034C14|nr:type IV conjugative transfer system protein TraE [Sphingobium sp. PNB]MCB4861623.1 type IV conjugative transfer system protein TraE [Sphingobium sp. PNB]